MRKTDPMLTPFAGWLVKPEWADRVISRAYDNLTPGQRRSIVRENPYSYVNVTRSSEDLLDDEDLSIDTLVTQGAAALTRLLDAEVFAPTGRRAPVPVPSDPRTGLPDRHDLHGGGQRLRRGPHPNT